MAGTRATMYCSSAALLREIPLPSPRSMIAMLPTLRRGPLRPGSRNIRAVLLIRAYPQGRRNRTALPRVHGRIANRCSCDHPAVSSSTVGARHDN